MRIPGLPFPIHRSFRLAPPEATFVRGVLVGEGVPTANLALIAEGLMPQDAPRRTTGTTAADGTFVMNAPVALGGLFSVRCSDRHLVLRPREDSDPTLPFLPAKVHEQAVTHQFVVGPAQTMRCTLRDRDGAPVAHAEVRLTLQPSPQVRRARHNRFVACNSALLAEGRSDGDGTVELTDLGVPEGESVVCEVIAPRRYLEHTFVVTKCPVQDLGVLQLGEAATIRGRVATARGIAVPAVLVSVQSTHGSCHYVYVVTDRNGMFGLDDLVPGKCVVQLDGDPSSAREIDLQVGTVNEVTVPYEP